MQTKPNRRKKMVIRFSALFFFFTALLTTVLYCASSPENLSSTASASPSNVSTTATTDDQADLDFFNGKKPFLGQAQEPLTEDNSPGEDFFVVGIISLPFTALYSFLGATIVKAVDQDKFPPDYDNTTVATAVGTALVASALIATISIDWSSKPTKKVDTGTKK